MRGASGVSAPTQVGSQSTAASASWAALEGSQHTWTQDCERLAWQVTRRFGLIFVMLAVVAPPVAVTAVTAVAAVAAVAALFVSCRIGSRSLKPRRRAAEAEPRSNAAEPPAEPPAESYSRAAAEPRT